MILDIEDAAVRAMAQGMFLAAAVAAQSLGPQIVAMGLLAAAEEFGAMQNDPGGLAAMAAMIEVAMTEGPTPKAKLRIVPSGDD